MPKKTNPLQELINSVLNTTSTGMSDSIPTTIDGQEPAALSEGEYVIPADAVSRLGDGSTEAGARILDDLIKNIRKETSSVEGEQSKPIQDTIEKIVQSSMGDESRSNVDKFLKDFLSNNSSEQNENISPDMFLGGGGLKSDILKQIFMNNNKKNESIT